MSTNSIIEDNIENLEVVLLFKILDITQSNFTFQPIILKKENAGYVELY